MSLQLWKKKMAIIAAMNKGYLLDVSGNPAVLAAALKKPLQGVTVYGASGGVGDATYNLFDVKTVAASLTRLSSSYPHIGRMYLQLHPDTDYTFWSDQPRYDSSGNDQLALAVNNGKSGSVISGTGVWLGQPRTVTTDSNGYLTVFSFKYGGSENWKLAEVADEYKFMAVEGAYTAETMPEYEPYGYKIPVLLGGINLFDENLIDKTLQTGVDITLDFVENGKTYTVSGVSEGSGIVIIRGALTESDTAGTEIEAIRNVTGEFVRRFTADLDTYHHYFLRYYYANTNTIHNIAIYDGSYTAETLPPYQPYGANKTINLYTPQQLTAAADTFAADIAAQTATLTAGGVSTDVSALQDWDQDFELTKGDNTVSIGTTVQPSAVEWRYLSSSRG